MPEQLLSSFARLDADMVLEAVTLATDRLDKRFVELEQAALGLEMRERGFLGMKWTLSRAEAQKVINREPDMVAHRMVTEQRKDYLRNIGNLALAATKGDGFIWVSASDFQRFAASWEIIVERRRLTKLTDAELADEQAAAASVGRA